MEETQQIENKITNEQLFHKMCEVEALLANPKVEKGLWSIQDIADYCGLSYTHTYTYIVTDPKFPAPVDIQGKDGSNKSKRLFVKTEVIAFFNKHKKKKYRV